MTSLMRIGDVAHEPNSKHRSAQARLHEACALTKAKSREGLRKLTYNPLEIAVFLARGYGKLQQECV
jgi:hypothetical protein